MRIRGLAWPPLCFRAVCHSVPRWSRDNTPEPGNPLETRSRKVQKVQSPGDQLWCGHGDMSSATQVSEAGLQERTWSVAKAASHGGQ